MYEKRNMPFTSAITAIKFIILNEIQYLGTTQKLTGILLDRNKRESSTILVYMSDCPTFDPSLLFSDCKTNIGYNFIKISK